MKRITGIIVVFLFSFLAQNGFTQSFNKYKNSSLYTDIKAHGIGDIVTILIIESTTGSQQSNLNTSGKSSLKADGSLTGNLTSILPLIGASTSFATNLSNQAGTAQKDGLIGKLTAVVTEILPNGNLRLQGRRRLEVNGESYLLDVKGLVRPKDIASNNIVFSYNLANVEIAYKKDGLLRSRPGMIARWSTWIMVMGLGAAAVFGISATN
ncbi:MAG: flagellar basal body L-ring protein FlgH [Caldithrix sp.]|nr:MAG: flagellar basal body L-ring protein FlgH [Caldithrix sp.]